MSNIRSGRFLTLLISFSLSLALLPAAQASKRPNSSCKKLGLTTSISGTKYVCAKSGKKLVWKKGPTALASSSSSNKSPLASDPVIARINSRLVDLPKPTPSQVPPVEWIYPADSNLERVKSLQLQHQRLTNQFPAFYSWRETAIALIDTNPTRILDKLLAANCGEGYIQSVRRLEKDSTLAGAGTSFCNDQLFAYFMDKNVSDQHWNFILGSEFGGIIQQNVAAAHKFKNFPNSNWYSEIPNWYAEGGQTLISVIAEAAETRKWSFDLKLEGGMQGGDWCMNDTLVVNRCSGVIGIAALQIAIALYGWDAPLTLFKYLEPNMNQAVLFESGFPDTFEQFNEWSSAYLRYVRYGTELPASLINRLK